MKKYDLIHTEKYLLVVDDSEIWVKIITHLPLNNSPILQGVDLLPPLEQEDDFVSIEGVKDLSSFVRGYDKAKEKYKYTEEDIRKAYYKGAADCRKCTERNWKGVEIGVNINELKKMCTNYIQSLSQPKNMPIGFECEIEYLNQDDKWVNYYPFASSAKDDRIKTTTNSQGQTQWVGKYIYA